MHAVTIVDGALEWRQHPDPQPGVGEVLVEVRAAGISNADLLQRAGFYPPPPGAPRDIPGLEAAGEIVELGPGATRFSVGDRVMAVLAGGGHAERFVVHERAALPVPAGVSWEQAGAFPENVTTAHDALFTQAALTMGERLCVHGAAGGVGTCAVLLGALAGAEVVATVRDEAKRAPVAALTPSVTVVAPEDFVSHGPFDVILELVGGPNLPADVDALAIGGRISVIGVGAGGSAEVNLLALMGKRGRILASTLRARPLEQKADAARRVERAVLPSLTDGSLMLPIAATFAMHDAAAAYDHFAAGGKVGKIVLVT
ncbi:MAG: alcohol dehydrogenase catalytic domain-containing protein [Microthrixaceae bacterium]